MKRLFSFGALLGLAACNWNGSASFSYSNSWKRDACTATKIKEAATEYRAKVSEYKKKYKGSPGELRYEEKSRDGCKSFYVGYSHKTHDQLGFCPFSGNFLTGKSLCGEMVRVQAQPLPL